MRTLELFAGTQSFSKAVIRAHEQNMAITVDILPKFQPTHVADILSWDHTIYPPGHFDVVWCSPPCEQYSKARTTGGPRDLVAADRNVLRCLELIDYYRPRVWIMCLREGVSEENTFLVQCSIQLSALWWARNMPVHDRQRP